MQTRILAGVALSALVEALKLIGLELWRFFLGVYLGFFPDKIILRFHMKIWYLYPK
jgi:hypothetical protein